jgi:DNA adenine methylase
MPKLEQAALTYSLIRQSRGGTLSGFSKSKRLRGEGKAVPAEKLTYDNAIPKLPSVANRLKDVDILNEDAIPLIEKHNDPQCLFYLDPPYHADTRTAKDVYGQEMSSKQHEILLDVCLKSQSKIIISGYPSELYAKVLTNWNLKTQQIVNHASHKGKKAKMTECLWMNF